MIKLRNFQKSDAAALYESRYSNVSVEQLEDLICQWNEKQVKGRYFEMFAVLWDGRIVGTVSLYQHSSEVISVGPEIFCDYRRRGFAKEAMLQALSIAKEKGFKIVSQQIRTDNVASIALHSSLGFETNGLVYTNSKGNEVAVYLKSLV